MGIWAVSPVGSRGKAMVEVWGQRPQKLTTLFVKMCYFEPVLRCMHDYANQFDIKWEKNIKTTNVGQCPT